MQWESTALDPRMSMHLGYESDLWALEAPQVQSDIGVGRDREEWEVE